tara:strand:+ start:1008 stop:1376 length:369 start_codon:yes stop_codon:yes gene_type:complete
MTIVKKLIFLCFFMLMLACHTDPGLLGSWELVSLNLAGDKITSNELGHPIFSFNFDHSYSIEVQGMSHYGTWKQEDGKLLLTDNETPETVNVLSIIQAEETIFHYSLGEGKTMTDVILKRVN